MNRLFKINESERERILNMHTSATSRQYLSEQSETNNYNDIKNALEDATGGLGTDVDKLVNTFKSISANSFDRIIDQLQSDTINGEQGLIELLKSELGVNNKEEMINISNIFKEKSKKYELTWGRGIVGNVKDIKLVEKGDIIASYDPIYEKFPCLRTNEVKRNTQVGVKNGFYYFIINGEHVKINEQGITEILDGSQYKRQMRKDAQGNEVPSLTYCQGNVTESFNVKNKKILNETPYIPGIGDIGGGSEPQDEEPKDDKAQDNQQTNQNTQQQTNQNTQQQQTGQQKGGQKLLKKGVKDDEVLSVKQKINKELPNVIQDLGINVSDNTYDPKTVAAVAYFQAKNNLKVDGIVGPETRGALSKISS